VDVPERLARYEPSEWPGETPEERSAAWRQARTAWAEAYPGGPMGDFLAMARHEWSERRRAAGWPTRYPSVIPPASVTVTAAKPKENR